MHRCPHKTGVANVQFRSDQRLCAAADLGRTVHHPARHRQDQGPQAGFGFLHRGRLQPVGPFVYTAMAAEWILAIA